MRTLGLMLGLIRLFLPAGVIRLLHGGRMPVVEGREIDPKAQALLDLVARVRGPDARLEVAESRTQLAGFVERFDRPPPPTVRRHDTTLPGAEGPRPARVYLPEGSTPESTLLFLHGGGWIQGSIETHDGLCAKLADQAGIRVISYDYRLAPEDPYPAASDDILAAYLALISGSGELTCDPGRLVVGGDSAGGNLAAVLLYDLATRGRPVPRAQLLIYPALDGAMNSASMLALGDSPLLSRRRMDWYLDQYLPPDQDRCAPRFSPLYAEHLRGQPEALILVAGHDPLWDEGLSYAEKLRNDGTPVEVLRYPGQVHGFLNLTRVLPDGAEAIARCATWLRQVMATPKQTLKKADSA
ncbi:LipN [Pseudooceanicola batsensis HTCC2597]|uniref:LipN n=1 Tax=Pseudooceanicola batsensis (strain ATCC BAA-863 / DSM 15984 / KCTC 12145 / HTCC2597) TaxID=252305 RepID=A3TWI2_PSEBH|nr:alpha/beta hydrolase [Pseudooceanicola batsensis]EAQ03978.1 LipN [Pseudooceanicola batsensis HTCC2597]